MLELYSSRLGFKSFSRVKTDDLDVIGPIFSRCEIVYAEGCFCIFCDIVEVGFDGSDGLYFFERIIVVLNGADLMQSHCLGV